MEARTETGQQCCVDEKCRRTPCNFCVLCKRYACDDHTDGREWEMHIAGPRGETIVIGLLCLACTPGNIEIRNSPQPVKETRNSISVEDCMRIQRVLENLK
jgi:hypothetical protein